MYQVYIILDDLVELLQNKIWLLLHLRFHKLVSFKVITFKQIASVDTWVQEERIFLGHGYSSSYLLKFQTISVSFEPDNERVDLARGQYLDAEKTKSQIEDILKTSVLESIGEI